MRTDNGYLRRSLVEVVYPGARYATLPAVAPWSWALRPCCLSSCAAQGSSRLSGANGGPTRSGPAVVGDSMADDVRQKLSGQRSSIPTNSCNSEAQLLALAETAVAHWHSWWRVPESASRLSLETRLDRNFRVCFPLSANAINHIEASLTARSRCPWRISDSFVRPWEAHTGSRSGARGRLTRLVSLRWCLTPPQQCSVGGKGSMDHRGSYRYRRLASPPNDASNDQNLWMALGLVTWTGAPSRG